MEYVTYRNCLVVLIHFVSSPKGITVNNSAHIFFITDQYWDLTMKSCEMNRPAHSGSIRVTEYHPEQKLPKQLKDYLSIGANKKKLEFEIGGVIIVISGLSEIDTSTSPQIM